jgi:hypothetical protein
MTGSPFFKGLMRVKEAFFSRSSFIIGNGRIASFVEDIWVGETALTNQYPSLYNIVQQKYVSIGPRGRELLYG